MSWLLIKFMLVMTPAVFLLNGLMKHDWLDAFLFAVANVVERQSLFQSGWFVVGLLTQTLIVHMIRTEKVPFLQSRAAPVVVGTTAIVMAVGMWLPFSPLASAFHLQPLPVGFFLYLPIVLVSYCLLTQVVMVLYMRTFRSWQ